MAKKIEGDRFSCLLNYSLVGAWGEATEAEAVFRF